MAYQQGPSGQQRPPHYGPPPGYGYPPPRPPRPGRGPLFWIFVVGLPLMLLFSCTAALVVVGSGGLPTTTTAQSAGPQSARTGSSGPGQDATRQAEAEQPAAEPTVLLTAEGSSTKNTQQFTVDATWELRYSFDCANFGIKSNFIVTIKDAQNNLVDVAVNALADKGEDATPLYQAGDFHLEVSSACNWKVTVVDLP